MDSAEVLDDDLPVRIKPEFLAARRAELAGQRAAIQRETTNIITQIVSSVAKLSAIPHSDSDVDPINLTVETLLEHIRILSLEATKEYGDGKEA